MTLKFSKSNKFGVFSINTMAMKALMLKISLVTKKILVIKRLTKFLILN